MQKLDAIGFPWDPNAAAWERGLAALRMFRRMHPGMWPKAAYRLGDRFKLGSWCVVQRLRRKQGRISAGRIERLDRIRFPWGLKNDLWDEAYPALQAYRRAHPTSWPPRHYRAGGLNLGDWCANARFRMRSGQMPQGRARTLAKLGFRPERLATRRLGKRVVG
jgi:hypothetical protein